jgi:hypothetical protein
VNELADLFVLAGVGLWEVTRGPPRHPDLPRVLVAYPLQLLDLLWLEGGHRNRLDAVRELAVNAAASLANKGAKVNDGSHRALGGAVHALPVANLLDHVPQHLLVLLLELL